MIGLDRAIQTKKLDRTGYLNNSYVVRQAQGFKWWNELSSQEKMHLVEQVTSIDLKFAGKLFDNYARKAAQVPKHKLVPPKVKTIPKTISEMENVRIAKQMGECSLRNGEAAVVTVAGGDGTRLGCNGPKGTLHIAPVSRKSIFQLHAEKICAIQQRYHTNIPWYIMTSKTNSLPTQDFFKTHHYFGLNPGQIRFFSQGMLPVLDLNGKLLMNSKSNIVMSPNGHGGLITAFKDTGILNDMKKRSIRYIFYHQVDNVLAKIADPVFIGYHLMEDADMSLKVVKKRHPEEKVGIVGRVDGKLQVVEYSELSREDMYAKNNDGSLKYNAGNIAIHMISIGFLEKACQRREEMLPYHAAIKKVPYIDEHGNMINPEKNNAIKFECFIFDMLKHAEKCVIMEVSREEEFSPVKNMEGEDSLVTAVRDMVNVFGKWLRSAGISIPVDCHGNVDGLIEINPSFALDEDELRDKIHNKQLQLNGLLYLE